MVGVPGSLHGFQNSWPLSSDMRGIPGRPSHLGLVRQLPKGISLRGMNYTWLTWPHHSAPWQTPGDPVDTPPRSYACLSCPVGREAWHTGFLQVQTSPSMRHVPLHPAPLEVPQKSFLPKLWPVVPIPVKTLSQFYPCLWVL